VHGELQRRVLLTGWIFFEKGELGKCTVAMTLSYVSRSQHPPGI